MRYQLRQAGVRPESRDAARATHGVHRRERRSSRAGPAPIRDGASVRRDSSVDRAAGDGYFFVAVGLGVEDGAALPAGVGDGVGVNAAPALSTKDLNCAAFATLPV
ncbi:MAG: hypothetical protein JWQ92_185 [Amnibacterium sp.]|nr:hypothetical protein [Amnibacterium sp.]